MSKSFTIGIEEEFQIVDLQSRELGSQSGQMLPRARTRLGDEVQQELHQSNIESASPVCLSLAEVRRHVVRSRAALREAAARQGCTIVAAGTHPFSRWQDQKITAKPRYQEISRNFAQVARENVIFGCHVHVGVDSPELALGVMNRLRAWLSPLLALTANSPFWLGEDTGYDSFRTELWWRWPLAGPPPYFHDQASYRALVQALVTTGSVEDVSKIYWDIRLPEKVATVEIRVCDVALSVDDAVMVAGLARGLVMACHQQATLDTPIPPVRSPLLKSAHWRAARHGFTSSLIDPVAQAEMPARDLVENLLDFIRPGLDAAGDWDEVAGLVEQTLARGNGAMRQREIYQRTGRLEDVVDFLIQETAL